MYFDALAHKLSNGRGHRNHFGGTHEVILKRKDCLRSEAFYAAGHSIPDFRRITISRDVPNSKRRLKQMHHTAHEHCTRTTFHAVFRCAVSQISYRVCNHNAPIRDTKQARLCIHSAHLCMPRYTRRYRNRKHITSVVPVHDRSESQATLVAQTVVSCTDYGASKRALNNTWRTISASKSGAHGRRYRCSCVQCNTM